MIDTEMSFWIEKKRDNQQATVAYLRNCRRKFDSKRMTWSHTSNERLPFLIEARGKLADLFLERHLIEQAIGDLEGREVKPYEFPETPLPSMHALSYKDPYGRRPGMSSWIAASVQTGKLAWSLSQMVDDYEYHYWKSGQLLKNLDTAIFMERWWGADNDHR